MEVINITMNKEKLIKLKEDFIEISNMVDDIHDLLNVNHLNYVGNAKRKIIELKSNIKSNKKMQEINPASLFFILILLINL